MLLSDPEIGTWLAYISCCIFNFQLSADKVFQVHFYLYSPTIVAIYFEGPLKSFNAGFKAASFWGFAERI